MPRIAWPKWSIPVDTGLTATDQITVKYEGHRSAFGVGEQVTLDGSVRYIQAGADDDNWRISREEDGRGPITFSSVGTGIVEKDAAIVVNYPSRPILRDPGAQVNTSVTNPLRVSSYTISEPRYEGSVELDVEDADDVPIVEAFIDQLSDPDAWFELPLPGAHIGANDVDAYDGGDLTISTAFTEDYLLGWFGRVGRRTVRVVANSRNSAGAHVIRIVPALITGTTSADSANVFSSAKTCRVRAVDVSATGNPDFDAAWMINWVETRGDV